MSPSTVVQQPEICDCNPTQKIREIYKKYVVENKYLNEVFQYFFEGVGLLWEQCLFCGSKGIIAEIAREPFQRRD